MSTKGKKCRHPPHGLDPDDEGDTDGSFWLVRRRRESEDFIDAMRRAIHRGTEQVSEGVVTTPADEAHAILPLRLERV
jgi:hypothetical protein